MWTARDKRIAHVFVYWYQFVT